MGKKTGGATKSGLGGVQQGRIRRLIFNEHREAAHRMIPNRTNKDDRDMPFWLTEPLRVSKVDKICGFQSEHGTPSPEKGRRIARVQGSVCAALTLATLTNAIAILVAL